MGAVRRWRHGCVAPSSRPARQRSRALPVRKAQPLHPPLCVYPHMLVSVHSFPPPPIPLSPPVVSPRPPRCRLPQFSCPQRAAPPISSPSPSPLRPATHTLTLTDACRAFISLPPCLPTPGPPSLVMPGPSPLSSWPRAPPSCDTPTRATTSRRQPGHATSQARPPARPRLPKGAESCRGLPRADQHPDAQLLPCQSRNQVLLRWRAPPAALLLPSCCPCCACSSLLEPLPLVPRFDLRGGCFHTWGRRDGRNGPPAPRLLL